MSRFAAALSLLSLLLGSVGCQMCPTPHDYRITGYIDRCDDYRGFNPNYRAGSVFGEMLGKCQTISDIYNNAGNFGVTTPVVLVSREPDPNLFRTTPINLPQPPEIETLLPPRPNGSGLTPPPPTGVPSIQDLIDRQRSTTPGIPTLPPALPGFSPLPIESTPSDAVPFSPSDEVISPPNTMPRIMDNDPPITLEELRRLDPTVHDLQIISIEDAAMDARMK